MEKIKDGKNSDWIVIIVLLFLQKSLNFSDLTFGVFCSIYILITLFFETEMNWKLWLKRVLPFITLAILTNIIL